MMTTVLFDLDGTLTDSKEGIFKSLEFCMNFYDYTIPPVDILQLFLGPPIVESLQVYCGLSEDEARVTYKKFQERYGTIGKFENKVYDGIIPLLDKLKREGYTLGVATAKPEVFAREILDHFFLTPYFDVIVGADSNTGLIHKEQILEKVLASCKSITSVNSHESHMGKIYMVGDRKYDVEAANLHGCVSVGVTYGYGSEEEIGSANAEYICDTPEDIGDILDIERLLASKEINIR